MAYNLTMVDADRRVLTAYVAPGRAAEFSSSPIATNHRGEIPDSIEHAQRYASVERRDCLAELLAERPDPGRTWSRHFSGRRCIRRTTGAPSAPSTRRCTGRPTGTVQLCWPDRTWERGFDDPDGTFDVVLTAH